MRDLITLVEALNTNAEVTPFQDPDISGHEFTVGGRKYVVAYSDDGENEYYMSFTGEDDRGRQTAMLLGHNAPFKVFSGVVSSMLRVIAEREPEEIRFSVDNREEKRAAAYDRLLDAAEKNGVMPDGYVWDRDQNFNYRIFRR